MADVFSNISRFADAAGDSVRKLAREAQRGQGSFRAYHGSKADFDAFDPEYIGTGEGAQAFSHGLYFAQHEPLSGIYRRRLAGPPREPSIAVDGADVFSKALYGSLPLSEKVGAMYLRNATHFLFPDDAAKRLEELRYTLPGDIEQAKKDIDEYVRQFGHAEDYQGLKFQDRLMELTGAYDLLRKNRVQFLPESTPGKQYEVEIQYPEDSLLDWDSPIGEQSTALPFDFLARRDAYYDAISSGTRPQLTPRDRLSHIVHFAPEKPGKVLYGDLESTLGAPGASAFLREAGVPGVRYFDGQSRSAGEGTRNYVMFPGTEDSIRILRKYGLLPATLGAEGLVNQQQAAESPAPAF